MKRTGVDREELRFLSTPLSYNISNPTLFFYTRKMFYADSSALPPPPQLNGSRIELRGTVRFGAALEPIPTKNPFSPQVFYVGDLGSCAMHYYQILSQAGPVSASRLSAIRTEERSSPRLPPRLPRYGARPGTTPTRGFGERQRADHA